MFGGKYRKGEVAVMIENASNEPESISLKDFHVNPVGLRFGFLDECLEPDNCGLVDLSASGD